jgi:hypothetical protein
MLTKFKFLYQKRSIYLIPLRTLKISFHASGKASVLQREYIKLLIRPPIPASSDTVESEKWQMKQR